MKNESIKLLRITFDAFEDGQFFFYCKTSTEIDPSWPSDWPYPELTYEGIVSDLNKMIDAGLPLYEMYHKVRSLSPWENQEYWNTDEKYSCDDADIFIGGDDDDLENYPIYLEIH